jgi:hypothetical protein
VTRIKPILIFGDSFSSDWGKDSRISWVDIISKQFDVVNVAQAGVGEYKIYSQIKSLDLSNFSYIIGNHTSHSRVHSRTSIHSTSMHRNCDLIYTDCLHRSEAKWFFENVYDDDYYRYIYDMIRSEIDGMLERYSTFIFDPFYTEYKNVHSFKGKWEFSPENKNHFSPEVNREIAELIKNKIVYGQNSSRES